MNLKLLNSVLLLALPGMFASLLVGLIWSYDSVLYPGARRQAAAQFQLGFQSTGSLSQNSTYQTPDDLPQVLGWYAQNFGLGHDMPEGDHCVTMNQVDTYLFLQRSLDLTLCAQPKRTLIFVNRNIAMR